MWLYGFHPVREALRSRADELVRVLVARSDNDRRGVEIRKLCGDIGIRLEEVDERRLGRLVDGVHNGFAAELIEVVQRPAETAAGGARDELILLVEDVQDPRNLGALIRVCDAVGVSRLLVRDRGSAPVGATAVKTSAGAAEWLPVERVTNSANEIERHKRAGFWVYGAAAEGVSPWELDLTGPLMICIGGEEKGLRRRTRQICDGLIGLPMAGQVESLNLATAASAILYEVVRQRATAPPGS